MEEKHIYSSSGWFKFFNFFNSYKEAFKELLSQVSKLKPKKAPTGSQIAVQKPKLHSAAVKPKPKVEKPSPKEEIKSEASPSMEARGIKRHDSRLRRLTPSLGSLTSKAGQALLIPEHGGSGNSETSLKIPKKYSELKIKLLVYALFAAIIALMGLGIFISFKG